MLYFCYHKRVVKKILKIKEEKIMLKRAFALLLCVIMVLPLLAACDKNGDDPDGMYSVTLSGEPFVLYVPQEWTDNRDSGISSAYYSLEKSIIASARYYSCDEATVSAGIEAYVANVAVQNEKLSGYAEVSRKDASLSGTPAYRYEYTYYYRGEEKNNTNVIQYYVFHKNDVVVLSMYIAKAYYTEEYIEMFEKIRTAFKLVDKSERNDDIADEYTPDGMKKASDDDVQYACYVPKSWVTDLSDKMTYAYYPESGKPNVTVTSYSPSENITAESYFKDCEREYQDTLLGYSRTEEPESRTVGGRNALSYVYTVTYGDSEYKIMQTVLIYNGLAYSITYTARSERYDAYLEDVKMILDNFRFR